MTTAMSPATHETSITNSQLLNGPNRKPPSRLRTFCMFIMIPIVVLSIYVLSVIVRVSVFEQKVFGRSALIPMSLNPRRFSEIPTMETYGAFNYNITFRGKPLLVHRQIINGYQHCFGSALVTSELGAEFADYLFRANEYMEAYCCRDGARMSHILDTRKDLHNNTVGRRIARQAAKLNLEGEVLENYLSDETLQAIRDRKVISHWLDREVQGLPTSHEYGCPGLPGPIDEKKAVGK